MHCRLVGNILTHIVYMAFVGLCRWKTKPGSRRIAMWEMAWTLNTYSNHTQTRSETTNKTSSARAWTRMKQKHLLAGNSSVCMIAMATITTFNNQNTHCPVVFMHRESEKCRPMTTFFCRSSFSRCYFSGFFSLLLKKYVFIIPFLVLDGRVVRSHLHEAHGHIVVHRNPALCYA